MPTLGQAQAFHLEKNKLTLLLENVSLALVGNLFNSGLLVYLLWGIVPTVMITTWLVAMSALSAIRFFLNRRQKRNLAAAVEWQALESIRNVELLTIALSAAMWAVAATFLFPAGHPDYVGLLAFVLAGTTAGALGTYTVSIAHALTYEAIVLFPFALRLAFQGDPLSMGMAAMTVLYFILLAQTIFRTARHIHQSLALQFEKEELMAFQQAQFESLRKVNNELQNTRQQLIKTVQMATLGEIAGSLAHEVNNPMMIVTGSFERLKKIAGNVPDRSGFEKTLSTIGAALMRIRQTVSSLLVFSNDQFISGDQSEVSIDMVCETAVQVYLSRYRNDSIRIIRNIPQLGLKVIGNEALLSQMIFLLMQSSYDTLYTPNMKEAWIQISVTQEGNSVVLQISDSGSSDRESSAPRVLPLEGPGPRAGHQLDIMTAKRIAEKHGGKIESRRDLPHFTLRMTFPTSSARRAERTLVAG